MTPDLARTLAFLQDIGLPVAMATPEEAWPASFCADVRIERGGLRVRPSARISNVLHEAGHLAVVPARFRPLLHDDVDAGLRAMMAQLSEENLPPDDLAYRAALQAGEAEATAWAWAAGVHLGLAPQVIIEDHEYNGEGPVIRWGLQHDAYLGINGLFHAEFCGRGPLGKLRGWPLYPTLRFWLQGGSARR